MGFFDKFKKGVSAAQPDAGQAKNAEPAKNAEQDNRERLLTGLLSEYAGKKDYESFEAALKCLLAGSVWVPASPQMSEETRKRFLNAQNGDPITMNQIQDMRPDILGKQDGSLLFPVFSQQSQAPEEYRQRFLWVRLTFLDCAQIALALPGVQAVVVNAFTQNVVLSEKTLRNLVQTMVKH